MLPLIGSHFLVPSLTSLISISSRFINNVPRGSISPVTPLDLSTLPPFDLTASLHKIMFGNGSFIDQSTPLSDVDAVLAPLADAPPVPTRVRSYFNFFTFLCKLPDNLFLPGIGPEALFEAMHLRSVSGMGTYGSLNSIFLTDPKRIESFVVWMIFTSKAAIYAGLPLSLALLLSNKHDFNFNSSLDVLKLFLGTQHT